MKTYIVDNTKGIPTPKGIEAPDGSWIIGVKVDDSNVWNDIKAGKVQGFSIEGMFEFIESKFSKEDNDGDIWISLVDATGREVKRQSFGYLKAGAHQLNILTADLPNGSYVCRLATATDVSIKRLIIRD